MNLGLGGFRTKVQKVKIATLLGLGDVRGIQGAEALLSMPLLPLTKTSSLKR